MRGDNPFLKAGVIIRDLLFPASTCLLAIGILAVFIESTYNHVEWFAASFIIFPLKKNYYYLFESLMVVVVVPTPPSLSVTVRVTSTWSGDPGTSEVSTVTSLK